MHYTFSLHIFVYTLLFLIDSKRAEMANMPKLHYAKMTILPKLAKMPQKIRKFSVS